MAIPVSLVNNSIHLPLEYGAFHVHVAIPFSFVEHFDSSIIQYQPRKSWVASLFGQGYSPQSSTELAMSRLRPIPQQLSNLLLGREEPIRFVIKGCDAGDWEHPDNSNFHWTFFLGAEDDNDARVLVFKANEKLVQGGIQFSGEELGEKEKAAWKAAWMNQVKTYERLDPYSPLEREIRDKNVMLHEQLRGMRPNSFNERVSFESSLYKDRHTTLESSAVLN